MIGRAKLIGALEYLLGSHTFPFERDFLEAHPLGPQAMLDRPHKRGCSVKGIVGACIKPREVTIKPRDIERAPIELELADIGYLQRAWAQGWFDFKMSSTSLPKS